MVGPALNSQNLTLNSGSIKLLCSYGGRILPRYPDGKLHYHGGDTRVLSVNSSVSFDELLQKMGDMYGSSVTLRCQFPTEDLDALVSITSDEDFAFLIDEYDRAAVTTAAPQSSVKIRAFLSAPKQVSPPPSATKRCLRRPSRPPLYPTIKGKPAGKIGHKYGCEQHHVHGTGGSEYLIHNGNHWQ